MACISSATGAQHIRETEECCEAIIDKKQEIFVNRLCEPLAFHSLVEREGMPHE